MSQRVSERTSAGRSTRWMASAGLALLAACASDPTDGGQHARSSTERKRIMLLGAERAIHVVLEDARHDVERLTAGYETAAGPAPRTFRIASSESSLATFGDHLREQRLALLQERANATGQQLRALVDHYEGALWEIAAGAGRREGGDTLGTRSGYIELDEKVDQALIQLARDADVDGFEQSSAARLHDDIVLDRAIRYEIPDVGVLSLYKSAPTPGLFAAEQEGQAIVVVLARSKEDPLESKRVMKGIAEERRLLAAGGTVAPAPLVAGPLQRSTMPLSFVQVVRRRIERGGLVVESTPWQLDPATADGGLVPISDEVDTKTHVVSELCIPKVDTRAASFRGLWDHVLITEYRTALRRDDTGEIVATMGWQVRWNIDFQGRMRVLVDRDDLIVPADPIVPALLAAAPQAE